MNFDSKSKRVYDEIDKYSNLVGLLLKMSLNSTERSQGRNERGLRFHLRICRKVKSGSKIQMHSSGTTNH